MPGMDKTGPMGRGMGPCGGGRQVGQGGGRGFRHGGGARWGMMPTTLSLDEEKRELERQIEWLETQLAATTQRLHNFEETRKTS